MNETQGKGISAVVGVIMLVAVGMTLVVIIGTFFISFASTSASDLSKSAPKSQVLSASQCISTSGELRLTNSLTESIADGTKVEIKEENEHYAFVRTTLQSLSAGSSGTIGFEFAEDTSRPFAFRDGKDYTITFSEGPARGQSVTLNCVADPDFIKGSLDPSRDILGVRATEDLEGSGLGLSCYTYDIVGDSWDKATVGNTSKFSLFTIDYDPVVDAYFVIEGDTGTDIVYNSSDDGTTWNSVGALPVPDGGSIPSGSEPSLRVDDSGRMFVVRRTFDGVSNNATIWRSTDQGQNWDLITFDTDARLRSIAFGDTLMHVVGDDLTSSYYTNSSDNGATWNDLATIPFGGASSKAHEVAVDSEGNVFVVGQNNSVGVIAKSSDNGGSWSFTLPKNTTSGIGPSEMQVIAIARDDVLYAIGRNTSSTTTFVFKSTDNGATWSLDAEISGAFNLLQVRVHPQTGAVIAVGEAPFGAGGVVFYNGTWQGHESTFENIVILYDLAFNGKIIAVGEGPTAADTTWEKAEDTIVAGDTFTIYAGSTALTDADTLGCISEDVSSNALAAAEVELLTCETDATGCTTIDVIRGVLYTICLDDSVGGTASILEGVCAAVKAS